MEYTKIYGSCHWWLRSPGALQHYVEIVSKEGDIQYNSSETGTGVRPALWIRLEDLSDEESSGQALSEDGAAAPDEALEESVDSVIDDTAEISLGSGTIRSDSGTPLNILAEWNASVSGANTVDVTVTVSVESNSLLTAAVPDALSVSVGSESTLLATPAVEIKNTDNPVTTLLNTCTFTIVFPEADTLNVPIDVVWNYRGIYGGVYLDTIECSETIQIKR